MSIVFGFVDMSIGSTYCPYMRIKTEKFDTVSWWPERPYNTLPTLPPPGELETKAVLKRCINARSALAELRQSAELLPNPSMLINTLSLLEAKASSEIENIVTTADQLFQFADDGEGADCTTLETLRYRRALTTGYVAIEQRPVTTMTVEMICSTIKGVDMAVRKTPGTKLQNNVTRTVVYTPPEGEPQLRTMLGNWERFMHDEQSLDPLVRMAVGHYQFEAIHPSIQRREWSHGPHPQHSVPRRAESAHAAHSPSQPIHQRTS